jgi:hypothetical protein
MKVRDQIAHALRKTNHIIPRGQTGVEIACPFQQIVFLNVAMGNGIIAPALGKNLNLLSSVQQPCDLPQNEGLRQSRETTHNEGYSHGLQNAGMKSPSSRLDEE